MVSAHRPQQVQRALERLSAFACRRSSGSCRRPRSAFADRSFTFRYRSGVGGFPGEALSGLPAASCRAGAKGRCGSCQGTGPSARASFRRRRSRRFFPPPAADTLPALSDRPEWTGGGYGAVMPSISPRSPPADWTAAVCSRFRHPPRSSGAVRPAIETGSWTALPCDRPGRHQNIPKQSACLVYRGKAFLSILRVPPRLHAPGQHDPRMVDPLAHAPDHAVFSKAGRAGGKLLQQPVQPLRRKLCEKPVLQQNALLFICQHFALLFVAAATYFFE